MLLFLRFTSFPPRRHRFSSAEIICSGIAPAALRACAIVAMMPPLMRRCRAITQQRCLRRGMRRGVYGDVIL